MTKIHTYYDTLSVVRNAPPEVIRAAYKILSQKHHPDRNADNPSATEVMAKINEAYVVLSDSVKRAKYDKWLLEQESSTTGQAEPAAKAKEEAEKKAKADAEQKATEAKANKERDDVRKNETAGKNQSGSLTGVQWGVIASLAVVAVWIVLSGSSPNAPSELSQNQVATVETNTPSLTGNCISGNCINGQGTLTFANGDKYVGDFKKGTFNGQGTLTFANGDKYAGGFKNDLMEGRGTYTFANGDKYAGGFKNNYREGLAITILANGTVTTEIWKNDALVQ